LIFDGADLNCQGRAIHELTKANFLDLIVTMTSSAMDSGHGDWNTILLELVYYLLAPFTPKQLFEDPFKVRNY
jgi:hypothetical protein